MTATPLKPLEKIISKAGLFEESNATVPQMAGAVHQALLRIGVDGPVSTDWCEEDGELQSINFTIQGRRHKLIRSRDGVDRCPQPHKRVQIGGPNSQRMRWVWLQYLDAIVELIDKHNKQVNAANKFSLQVRPENTLPESLSIFAV